MKRITLTKSNGIANVFYDDFEKQRHCDVSVIGSDGGFFAHRAVLGSASSVLENLFYKGLPHQSLIFPLTTTELLRQVVEMIYKRKASDEKEDNNEFDKIIKSLSIQFESVSLSAASKARPMTSSSMFNTLSFPTECNSLKTHHLHPRIQTGEKRPKANNDARNISCNDENEIQCSKKLLKEKTAKDKKPQIACPAENCDKLFKNEALFTGHYDRVHVKNVTNRRRCSILLKSYRK